MPARIFDDMSLDGARESGKSVAPPGVVISGISGRLPESENLAEFRDHLINGDDMVTENNRRWEPGLHGLPRRGGTLKDLTKFDASFFGVHPKQANGMDPQLRMLLEVTYEALIDAGVKPSSVRGSRTGVFIGCSSSESHEAWSSDPENIVGYEMTGCTRSMFANRVSYFFNFQGPSYAIDTACSSSLLALDQALHAIRNGQCDAAIVGGSSICLKPTSTLQFLKLGMLSSDGACKSFDASGNGYCRSEAVAAVYLQKERNAKRIYATLVHSGNNSDGHKKEGITFPSGEVQQQLLRTVYSEARVDPSTVAYVEAHGTGTKAGDPQEANSIVEIFCKGRQGPLLIGSTKSNMGHPEPASGLAALIKVLIAMEDEAIPANLHYTTPNPDIAALEDGRLQVVAERQPWSGGYVGINSFGFGGSNVHALLKSNPREPALPHPASTVPRLVTWSARTEDGVSKVLQHVMDNRPEDVEFQALLEETACSSSSAHPYRGFAIVNSENKVTEIQKCGGDDRPVWFVFAGMGTQWCGMGRDLMVLDVFRHSIMRSDLILKPHNINLYDLLMQGDESTFENTLNSFVSIAAIQVALVDVLTAYGIKPDGIVGHSVGELGCAYADGGLTAEETVLAAYWRGRCVQEANLPPGGMAAVGLTWEEAKERCPEGVVPACHNSIDTVTISGPTDAVIAFVAELQEEGVFARNVKSAGVAFHSHYMARTAPALREALLKVIKEKRPRTARWVSSSIPQHLWTSELARHSSAEYHVNNLVSPVLFQEALTHVPGNAVTIEIAPHCLLQAILKRSLSPECTFVGLMKRNHANNLEFLFSNLGKCFMAGVDFNPLSIYPPVQFPVSRGVPMVAPLVHWDHSQSWSVPKADDFSCGGPGAKTQCSFEIDASPDSKDHYLVGHQIDGRVLFPATGYLMLAWRALARMNGKVYNEMAVVFDNVHIHRATILPKTGTVTLDVSVMPGTGDFEVCESGALVVSGTITTPGQPTTPELPVLGRRELHKPGELIQLTSSDIYKELRLRGYDYGPTFQGIISASSEGDEGYLNWTGNWVSFVDAMLQVQVLGLPGRSLRLPTRIRSLRIDPHKHAENITEIDSHRQAVKILVDRVLDTCVAGGIEIHGLHATVAPRRQGQQTPPTLEEFHFVPYVENDLFAQNAGLHQYSRSVQAYIRQRVTSLLANGNTGAFRNVETFRKVLEDENEDRAEITNEELKNYLNAPGCGLMRVLHSIFDVPYGEAVFVYGVKEVLRDNKQELLSDQLLSALLCERILKPCLDVALENSPSMTKMKVVEVGAPLGHMFPNVIKYLNSQPMLNISYTATGDDIESLDKGQLEGLGVETMLWDLSDPAPGTLGGADLVVANGVVHRQADISASLSNIHDTLRDEGFLLLHEVTQAFSVPLSLHGLVQDLTSHAGRPTGPCNQSTWASLLHQANFEIIAQQSDGLLSTLFLCRKRSPQQHEPVVTMVNVSDLRDFTWVEEVKAGLADHQGAPSDHSLWVVVDGAPQSGVVGMVNCLKQEPGGDRLRCIFNADLSGDQKLPDLSETSPLFADLLKKDLVMNVYRNQQWGSFRHLSISHGLGENTIPTEHAYVNVLTRGDLSSLKWIESPLKFYSAADNPGKELCSVSYTSLNFRDVMLATGKLPPDAIPGNLASHDCLLGMEFAGTDPTGKRIMGLLPAKGLATTVDVDRRFLWDVPSSWTLEAAASVPVVYTTAYYALVVRGRIRRGDKVLIQSGSGGVGQAAIAIALHHGCEVFTTVGSKEKREYLKQRFPQLSDHNFSNSRDTSFAWDILRATGGRGVDVILNSLAEDKLQASVRILAQHGRFLEIGKYDLSNNTPLGMAVFLKNISFHGILLDALFEEGNADWQEVADLLAKGIKEGAVRPLNTTVFDKDDVESAFRFMAQGKHIGKVIVKIREESSKEKMLVNALPRTVCHPHKVYILSGGLGGFGLELAHWLVSRGARSLLLTSRSGVRTGYQAKCIEQWRDAGVKVKVTTHNVRNLCEAEGLVEEARTLGPVGGVFQLAMVLRDGLMENQTQKQFQEVADPKVTGTIHLDRVTRQHCADTLDWFVVFSSVSCGRGNAGQANYGFANSAMERVCEQRRKDGLAGLAVQWGAIGDVGVVMDSMGSNDTVIGGTLPQRITSCLSALDHFLNQSHPVVSSFVCAEKRSKVTDGHEKADLVDSVAHILGVTDSSSLNPDTTLADLGLDSLMGVEIKQTLERDHDLILAMREIRQLTVNKLRLIASGTPVEPSPDLNKPRETGGERENAEGQKSSSDLQGVTERGFDVSRVLPSETLVKMKDGPEGEKPLFVIHPVEGSVHALRTLMSLQQCPVYGLQCTVEVPLTSVPEVATFYVQKIKSIQPDGPYRLAGYSFGATVAYEMALQLQQSDIGQQVEPLILLDGSPAYVAAQVEGHVNRMESCTPEELESIFLCGFVVQIVSSDYMKLHGDLMGKTSFEARIQHAISHLVEKGVTNDVDSLEVALRLFYHRLAISHEYKPSSSLTSDIVLFRAKSSHQQVENMGNDYRLSEMCSGEVTVHVIAGDHESFIQGDSAVQITETMSALRNESQA